VRVAERCRIVLLAAEGLQDKQIAERISVAPLMASRWRSRFLARGCRISEGCAATGPHANDHRGESSRNRGQDHADDAGERHAMVAQHEWATGGISDPAWAVFASSWIEAARVASFKIATIRSLPQARRYVGLYLDPPEHALVLSVDEKSQIQALDRTQPGLPMKKAAARR